MSSRARNGRPGFDGWCLQLPDLPNNSCPRLIPGTFAVTRDACWGYAFDEIADKLGIEWRDAAYGRWKEVKADARKRGYRLVRVRLTVDERDGG